jgi:aspartyl-tRNA(Asn)/glutamyl-tRNA(Gln) amidotransferase subunit A
LGTSTEDVARVLEVIAGADGYDSTVSTLPVPKFSDELQSASDKKYRIAYIRETVKSEGLQPEIKETLQRKLNRLKREGHTIEAIDFPLLEYSLPTYYILATAEASSNLSRYDGVRYGYRSPNTTDLDSLYKKSRTEALGKEVQRRILLGTFVLSASYYDAYYTRAQKVRQLIRQRMVEVFTQYDFILLPTAPTTAFSLGANTTNPLQMYLADLYSVLANVSGIPGISVPCGKDNTGLPIGLQVLAGDFQESALLAFSNLLLKLD